MLEFCVYKLTSDEEIETKILELKDKIEEEYGEIPYIRFNIKEGHIALPAEKEDMNGKELKADDKHVIKVHNMSLEEKK